MIRRGVPIVILALILDQVTKWVAYDYLWNPSVYIRLTSFLNLTPVENRGVSFGLFESEGNLGVWIISAFSLIIAIGLVFWMIRSKRRWVVVGLGLIIGGALGNVIDRLRLGWVIDFIDFHVANWHWPAFNFADATITIGVLVMFIDGLSKPSKMSK